MSGDVQPRKRKDKKRKKDDILEQQQSPPPFIPHIQKSEVLDDINIHVHKEAGTGGGVCAKIIFFFLFSALIVLIGLIITEHRGITDLDNADTDSRFSAIFEGWTDTSHQLEDEHDDVHDDGDDEHDDGDDEHDDGDDEHVDDELSDSKEDDHINDDENDILESAENNDEDDLSEEQEDNLTQEASDEGFIKDDENESSEDDQLSNERHIHKIGKGSIECKDDCDSSEDIKQDNDSEENNSEDIKQSGQQDNDSEENNSAPSEGDIEPNKILIESNHKLRDKNYIDEYDEDIESEQSPSKSVKDRKDKDINEETSQFDSAENPNVVIKYGVGAAILVVAYTVLVRKWRSAELSNDDDEVSTDLSRRNTIVVPPQLVDLEEDIDLNAEGQYSDEGCETESEDDGKNSNPKLIKAKYQELRTTYKRSLNPEDMSSSSFHYYNNLNNDKKEYTADSPGYEYTEDSDNDNVEDDIEEIESENDSNENDGGDDNDYDDNDDDDELLERLEAKYGKLTSGEEYEEISKKYKNVNLNLEMEEESGEFSHVTAKDDWKIKDHVEQGLRAIPDNPAYALKLFDSLLEKYPFSPRSLYGKAQALDKLAEIKRSNKILQQSITLYLQILETSHVPDVLFVLSADRCINRLRFLGNYRKAIAINKILISRYPENASYRNQLAVSYLTINKILEARNLLKETLSKWPTNGFALVHYGFILKTYDNDLENAVTYMKKGIASKEPGVIDGRFYFHLGDALVRLGNQNEANQVYEEGVKYRLFLSKYQRSLYNVPHLTSKPWWNIEDTVYKPLANLLKKKYVEIYKEGVSVLTKQGYFKNESENLKDKGEWKQFELFARGKRNSENCKKCPITCSIIESLPDARNCKRGQTKFSVMHPGTHVWPHCGPTNCRLRIHLGLKVPSNTFIRVADQIRSWKEGEVFVFDDSFEHEVWHNGTDFRLVLIVDVWHPELSLSEKSTLSPI